MNYDNWHYIKTTHISLMQWIITINILMGVPFSTDKFTAMIGLHEWAGQRGLERTVSIGIWNDKTQLSEIVLMYWMFEYIYENDTWIISTSS